ncbi:MAG: LysR family transcriptional regulator [Steroidobacteraceae bacterium]|nr:LysR family transcriptional regulator [Steroidobacteraceae bacterium]MDW8260273.1 LysR family transcriptional regulator [Gammaproteobacteria bacterium]
MKQIWTPAYLATLAKVVELNGFGAAATALRVPKAAVSRAVAELEAQLGVQVLHRTTRRLRLTPAGEILLPHCQRIAAAAAAVLELAATWRASLAQGPLRVRAEPAFGRALLAPLVPRFLEAFPDIPLDVQLAPVVPGTACDAADVQIWLGRGDVPGHVVRELGAPPALLCASTAYVQKHGLPQRPEELATHAILMPGSDARHVELRLAKGDRRAAITVTPKLAVNDPAVLHSATVAGLGIGLLPEFLCRQGLAQQKLHAVLADWELPDQPPLCAVYRHELAQDRRVVSLVDFLAAHIVPALAGR